MMYTRGQEARAGTLFVSQCTPCAVFLQHRKMPDCSSREFSCNFATVIIKLPEVKQCDATWKTTVRIMIGMLKVQLSFIAVSQSLVCC